MELITTDDRILKRLKADEINAKRLRIRATLAADTAYLDDKYSHEAMKQIVASGHTSTSDEQASRTETRYIRR